MNLQSLMGPGAWEHYRHQPAVPMDAGRRQTRQVINDTDMCNGCENTCEGCFSNAVCVMDWNRCTEKSCDLYASGCPHFTEEGS